jgi:hypothetical protein
MKKIIVCVLLVMAIIPVNSFAGNLTQKELIRKMCVEMTGHIMDMKHDGLTKSQVIKIWTDIVLEREDLDSEFLMGTLRLVNAVAEIVYKDVPHFTDETEYKKYKADYLNKINKRLLAVQ